MSDDPVVTVIVQRRFGDKLLSQTIDISKLQWTNTLAPLCDVDDAIDQMFESEEPRE